MEPINSERQLSTTVYNTLKAAGYDGENVIEDLISPINKYLSDRGVYYRGRHPWWVYVRKLPENEGKELIDIIKENLLKFVKDRDISWLGDLEERIK